MADGKRRDEWERTAAVIQWFAGSFAGKRIDPEALNPVKPLPVERIEDPEADRAEAAEGWANLRAAFTIWAGQHYGGGGN